MDSNPQNTESETTPPTPSAASINPIPEPQQARGASTFNFDEISLMAALSYIGPLVLIPFLTNREKSFVMFHIKQGLVLLILGLLIYVTSGFLFFLWPILMIINVGLLCLSIIGVINALQNKEKELPFVGGFASYIKL